MCIRDRNEDIKNNKELYDIDAVDKNIDFRRVKNLKVYFDNNAISLTTVSYTHLDVYKRQMVTGFDRPNLFFRVVTRKGGSQKDNSIINYVKDVYKRQRLHCFRTDAV